MTDQGRERFYQVRSLMEESPDWAEGLHLRAAGGVVDRYRKLTDDDEIE